jgi:pSer/pThr/pTyr-binding forkhead associated (FHA) protein
MLFTHSASFSTPAPPAGLPAAAANTASTSPPGSSRSRLRRLSQLRNYHPGHLLSRDSTGGSGTSSAGDGLTRSSTEINGSVPRSPLSPGTTRNHRLTLVNSAPMSPQSPSAGGLVNSATAVNLNASPPLPPLPASPDPAHAAPSIEVSPVVPAPSASDNARASPAAEGTTSSDGQHENEETSTVGLRPSSEEATGAVAAAANQTADMLPSLRLSAYYDPRSTRPSLTFPPISRTLPTGTESIRVGRYSERDSQSMSNMPNGQPSAAPVGFKSKVVSRRHCEFWYENGKWFIKDVKSSSGTFLNHIRLSPPSQESKAFPVNDGDIVQLGIDFKGGEEMIFRCVKMRIELNRGWQNKLNTFNMAAHKRLRTMASTTPAGGAGSTSQDCSICLNSIAPCQSLFVAPCSHTWHFKCVRSLLTSPQYPIFICPNCRAGADLEADVDEPGEDWDQLDAEVEDDDKTSTNGASLVSPPPTAVPPQLANISEPDGDAMDVTVNMSPTDAVTSNTARLPLAGSEPVLIRSPPLGAGSNGNRRAIQTPSPPTNGAEGPITPRTEVGPWVFDGSAGQRPQGAAPGMGSLDAAADVQVSGDSSDTSMR